MREKKKVDISQAKISPPLTVLDGASSIEPNYELFGREYGLAEKLWELLRRNPDFRDCAAEFSKMSMAKKKGRDRFDLKIQEIDQQNPFAGFTLRWLFRPKYFDFRHPRSPEKYSKPLSDGELLDIQMNNIPWISEEWLDVVENIRSAETSGEIFAGPLTVAMGPFCLDTPWSETPELFQFLFSWLWDNYEISHTRENYSTWHFHPGEVSKYKIPINWDFLEKERVRLDGLLGDEFRKIKTFFEQHELFAIPKIIFTRKTEKILKEEFAKKLRAMRFIDVQKHPNLLGSENDWLIFNSCYPKIIYFPRGPALPNSKRTRSSLTMVIRNFVTEQKAGKKWGRGENDSNWETHATKSYEEMQDRMEAVFPTFDFVKLLKFDLGEGYEERLANMAEVALYGTKQNLKFLTQPTSILG